MRFFNPRKQPQARLTVCSVLALTLSLSVVMLQLNAPSYAQDSAPTLRSLTDRARAFHRAGALNEAITTYQQALTLSPNNAPLKNEYARVLFQVGRVADAKSMIESALPGLNSNQEKAKAWDYMGRIHENQQRIPQAIEAYQSSLAQQQDTAVQAKLNALSPPSAGNSSATSGKRSSKSAPAAPASKTKPTSKQAKETSSKSKKDRGAKRGAKRK